MVHRLAPQEEECPEHTASIFLLLGVEQSKTGTEVYVCFLYSLA